MAQVSILDAEKIMYCDLPLVNIGMVVRGPGDKIPSHGTHYLGQTFAYDICGVQEGSYELMSATVLRHLIGSVSVSCCAGWNRTVLCPASGRIVELRNDAPDILRLNVVVDLFRTQILAPGRVRNYRELLGNYVIVEGEGCFFLVAHLRQGSICVRQGEMIHAGQPIAALGNSGNTTFPHIHIQAMDSEKLLSAHGLPLGFNCYEEKCPHGWTERRRVIPHRGTLLRRLIK